MEGNVQLLMDFYQKKRVQTKQNQKRGSDSDDKSEDATTNSSNTSVLSPFEILHGQLHTFIQDYQTNSTSAEVSRKRKIQEQLELLEQSLPSSFSSMYTDKRQKRANILVLTNHFLTDIENFAHEHECALSHLQSKIDQSLLSKEDQNDYALLLSKSKWPQVICDADFKVISCSDSFETIYGRKDQHLDLNLILEMKTLERCYYLLGRIQKERLEDQIVFGESKIPQSSQKNSHYYYFSMKILFSLDRKYDRIYFNLLDHKPKLQNQEQQQHWC